MISYVLYKDVIKDLLDYRFILFSGANISAIHGFIGVPYNVALLYYTISTKRTHTDLWVIPNLMCLKEVYHKLMRILM